MSSEQAIQGSSQISASVASLPLSGSPADINIMRLLMMLEKGALNSNGELEKYYAEKQDDSVWKVGLMKVLEEEVSKGKGHNSYKSGEAIIEKYLKDHDMNHFDANQILAIHDLEHLAASLKSKDAVIAALLQKVAHDEKEYNDAKSRVQDDENNNKDPLGNRLELDKCEENEWDKRVVADNDLLKADEIEERALFSQGADSIQNEGQRMKSVSQYELGQLQEANRGIMSFSSGFFVAHQQV